MTSAPAEVVELAANVVSLIGVATPYLLLDFCVV